MAILNYTTSITAEKTASEIQRLLASAKAQAILYEYDDDAVMCAMSFRIMTPHGMIFFKMPAKTDGVYVKLNNDPKVPRKLKTREQAAKVAWRILKDWVEAQLAMVEADMAKMAEVFLSYAQNESGETLYQSIEANGFKALTHENK